MRKVLLGLLVLGSLVIGTGVYLNWFGLSPQRGEGDKANHSVTVDKEKIKADMGQAKQKAKELAGKVKGTGTAAQANPTSPGSAPAVEAKGD